MDNLMIASNSVMALSVLSSSLLGSAHCLGMCGGIALVVNKNRYHTFFYHLGRLLSYICLGAIAALIGQETLGKISTNWSVLISPLTLGVIFIYLGIIILQNKKFHLNLPAFLSKPLSSIAGHQSNQSRASLLGAFLVGLFSISLPCGWLYGFAIGAAATKEIELGVLIMFMFWLGTVPMLIISPALFHKVIEPLKNRFPKASALVLITAGLFTIGTAIYRYFL